jgi:acyl-CoA synthetase (AMP-forming)/AMP-acid ligase II
MQKKPQKPFALSMVRYTFPGDFATVEADGSITLLGRGSMCINTAGEKVFPEEVEEAIKQHVQVEDCLVVGVDDERFGQKVVALVSKVDSSLSEPVLQAHCRESIAGYKLPKKYFVCRRGAARSKW